MPFPYVPTASEVRRNLLTHYRTRYEQARHHRKSLERKLESIVRDPAVVRYRAYVELHKKYGDLECNAIEGYGLHAIRAGWPEENSDD
jgi:hypothetical protein